MENHDHDVYDLGLNADLAMLKRSPIDRRRILKMGAVGIGLLLTGGDVFAAQSNATTATYLPLITKPGDTTATATPTTTATTTVTATTTATATATTTATATATPTSTTTTCVSAIPSETNGPYPADGSNGANGSSQKINALTISGIVRSDIRTSLTTKNTAPGVPFTMVMNLVNTKNNCAPLVNYAVYVWHCNREGNYSLYSSGVTSEDYLRGVQVTDSSGKATFTSIFPACYSGRWPHVHFEVYPSLAQATSASNVLHTSQMALPQDICQTVYATSGYSASTSNLSKISLATDNVFSDGWSLEMATVTGDVTNGYIAQLTVGVAV